MFRKGNFAALLIVSVKVFVEYTQKVATLLVEYAAISGSKIKLFQLGVVKRSEQIHPQMKPNLDYPIKASGSKAWYTW